MTPAQWMSKAKVRRAQHLLETTSFFDRADRDRGGIWVCFLSPRTFQKRSRYFARCISAIIWGISIACMSYPRFSALD